MACMGPVLAYRRTKTTLHSSNALVLIRLANHIERVFVYFFRARLGQFALELQTCLGHLGRV
jgi:hypothetical protein